MSDEEKKIIDQKKKEDIRILVWDRLLESVDIIVAKLTSGKFLAVTLDTVGYTGGVIITGFLAYKKMIEPETFIAVLGTYSLLVQKTRENYFWMKNGNGKIEQPQPPQGV